MRLGLLEGTSQSCGRALDPEHLRIQHPDELRALGLELLVVGVELPGQLRPLALELVAALARPRQLFVDRGQLPEQRVGLPLAALPTPELHAGRLATGPQAVAAHDQGLEDPALGRQPPRHLIQRATEGAAEVAGPLVQRLDRLLIRLRARDRLLELLERARREGHRVGDLRRRRLQRVQVLRDGVVALPPARRAEQAEAMRREEDRVWQDTGADGTEAGLRAYLERYPEGRYAADARRHLDEIETAQAEERARDARRAWRDAREQDTLAGYEAFLERFGNSEFADAARSRIAEMRNDDTDRQVAAARAEEREIVTNTVTRLLVEQRLMGLGYSLGMADGNFTDQTRRAIRQYQEDRGIFVSGYVSKRTAAFLLAGR